MLDGSFTGVLCPIVAPLADGKVNEESLASLTKFILDGGVDGLFPCGTTSEFASLAPMIAGAAGTSVPDEDAKEISPTRSIGRSNDRP